MPFIQPEIKDQLYDYIKGISVNFESPIVRMNGTEDHVQKL